ncbi:MAG: alpha/beta fold hydrolase, partial [Thalassolituus sp.]
MIIDGDRSNPTFILAHGAGADSRSEFMTEMAGMISEQGICVVRFDFPYMIKRQEDGKKRPPDRAPKLIDAWLEVIEGFQGPVVIGGKSMGGRIASLAANSDDIPDKVKG